MNRRKAKKALKKKYKSLNKYPGNIPPKLLDRVLTDMIMKLHEELEKAILYGYKGDINED